MRFLYTAQDQKGNTVRGDIEAKDRKDGATLLVAQGLTPLSLTPAEERAGRSKGAGRAATLLAGTLNTFDQIIITRHLGTILAAGTDLLSALTIIAQDSPKPLVRRIMRDVKSRVATGEAFSVALAAWKAHFNPIFLSLVKAGEASGNLPQVLQDYSKELRKDYTFQRRVKGAMFYPLILITALGGMMLLMLWVVVPRLKELFRSTGAPAPWYTRVMFVASDIWRQNYVIVLVVFFLAGAAFVIALRNPKLRHRINAVLWHIPYLSRIHKNSILLHFAKTLSSLIRAGFDLKRGLVITGEALEPKYGKALAAIASGELERGIPFADALKARPELFPPILVSLVATGEKSGQLEGVLVQMAEFYEEEVIYALEQFLTIIEPVLIVFVGLIVGLMAGSLISPIYRFIGRF